MKNFRLSLLGRLFVRHLLQSGCFSSSLCYLHTSPSVLELAGTIFMFFMTGILLFYSCWLDNS
jgi:hypothetical protein